MKLHLKVRQEKKKMEKKDKKGHVNAEENSCV